MPIETFAKDYPAGWRITEHQHKSAQAVFARSGVMRVHVTDAVWMLLPSRLLWVPEGVEHAIECITPVSLRTVYFDTAIRPGINSQPEIVTVTPLLREVILKIVQRNTPLPQEQHLFEVFKDEIRSAHTAQLQIPMPVDSRVMKICNTLLANPADETSLKQWATQVGASDRTLSRCFLAETGASFRRWRQQVRLISSLQLLAQGVSVTNTALDSGFHTPSAYIAAFREFFGKTPREFRASI